MKDISVIIIDDEPNCIETLSILLLEYNSDIHILGTATDVDSGLKLIEKHAGQTDILFLDIQMPGGDGFSLLQQIPRITFKVIFTTAHDQYAIRAFKFSALDYLLKPIDNDQLGAALERYRLLGDQRADRKVLDDFVQSLHHRNLFEKIAVPTVNEIRFVRVDAIVYLESDNSYTTLHLGNNEKLVSSKGIGFYEELLSSSNFFRIHNSFLVNLRKVESYVKGRGGYIRLDNGARLEVAVRKKDELMKVLQLT